MEDNLKIIGHNIALTAGKAASLNDIRYSMYREAALQIEKTASVTSTDGVVRIFEFVHGKNLYEENPCDFARYCIEVTDVCADRFGRFKLSPCPTDTDKISIAYMKNSYSDASFSKFSSYFKKASAVYFPGFREVCEDVYNGHCTHAMIPVYSSKDGQLLSFRKLIAKYDLKIIYECDVEMNDDSVMRYSLLQKPLSAPRNAKYMDLSVVLPDCISLSGFLSACECLGGNVIMANSIPLEYADDKYNLNFLIEIKKLNLHAMYLFLEGAQVSYDIIGLYDVLN